MSDGTIRAVIWDMGGVILRTEDKNPRELLARKYGLCRETLEELVFNSESAQLAHLGKISEGDHWRTITVQFGLADEDEVGAFRRAFWSGDRVDAELVTYIRGLRPTYKTGLLSNAWQDTRWQISQHFNFLDAFDISLFSAEIGIAKPDPNSYRFILSQLGIEPQESVFIDDCVVNVDAARELGMYGIHFTDRQRTLDVLQHLLDGRAGS
ncbi:MAG: HAD family phosphatase [Anaerolineaceae bacterium]|nr:HAD family phosphatase [Anaerolineaceae bacterium]